MKRLKSLDKLTKILLKCPENKTIWSVWTSIRCFARLSMRWRRRWARGATSLITTAASSSLSAGSTLCSCWEQTTRHCMKDWRNGQYNSSHIIQVVEFVISSLSAGSTLCLCWEQTTRHCMKDWRNGQYNSRHSIQVVEFVISSLSTGSTLCLCWEQTTRHCMKDWRNGQYNNRYSIMVVEFVMCMNTFTV